MLDTKCDTKLQKKSTILGGVVKTFCPLSGSGLVNFTDLRWRAGTKKPGTWGDVPGGVSGLWWACGGLVVWRVWLSELCLLQVPPDVVNDGEKLGLSFG